MEIWDDWIGGLWPEEPGAEDSLISYLRKRLDVKVVRQALTLRLSPDLGADGVHTVQTDWDWHYRFMYSLIVAFVFTPEDPAQWFVDAGLNKYPDKARDVMANIAIVEQRQAAIYSLVPKRPPDSSADLGRILHEWVVVQANPAWVLPRWVMQIAIGLEASGDAYQAGTLLQQLPEEHMNLLVRYISAMKVLTVAARQAVTEAIERPDQPPVD